jgi:hypothetical protein
VVDNCWAAAPYTVKPGIADELLKHEATLSRHYLGKRVLSNCRLQDFKRSRSNWLVCDCGVVVAVENKQTNKQTAFQDGVGEER